MFSSVFYVEDLTESKLSPVILCFSLNPLNYNISYCSKIIQLHKKFNAMLHWTRHFSDIPLTHAGDFYSNTRRNRCFHQTEHEKNTIKVMSKLIAFHLLFTSSSASPVILEPHIVYRKQNIYSIN